MRTSPTGRCEGFTLIELLVVIFILSLTVSLVFPSLYPLREREAKAEAKRIASMLRYLNDSAIATKQTYAMKFDLREQQVSLKGPDLDKAESFKDLREVELQSRGMLSGGQVTVFFGPLGIQENMAVYLGSEKERMKVEINAMSGRVKIRMKDEG